MLTVTGDNNAKGILVVEGAPLPPMTDKFSIGKDPAFGLRAPLIRGTDWNNNPVGIDPDDQQAKVVVFLAHWCPYCQAEVPALQQWINTTPTNFGTQFIAVTTSINPTRPNWPPGDWLEREGWTPPTILDDGENRVADAYGLVAFPYWVVINKEGFVVHRIAASLGTVENFEGIARLANASLYQVRGLPGQ